MILFDANVLVHAFRPDAPEHRKCKQWVEATLKGQDPYGVSPAVLALVVRICTHPRIFIRPSSRTEVLGFCRTVLEHPNARIITPGQGHWSTFESLCEAFEVTGNAVQMAWFVALAIESGCEWSTTDPEYSRFKESV